MIARYALGILTLISAMNIAAADAVIDKPNVAPVFSGTSVLQVILSLA